MSFIKGVIFDMDGTITEPLLDFERIRAEIGVPSGTPLLESISAMDPESRRRARGILHEHESAAARASTLNEGVPEVLAQLKQRGVMTAVVTRNRSSSTEVVLRKHGLEFAAVITREDGEPKPMPDGVLAAAAKMGVPPKACLMVGDYEFDIQAGRAAGAITVLYAPSPRSFATEPDFLISRMTDLLEVLDGLENA